MTNPWNRVLTIRILTDGRAQVVGIEQPSTTHVHALSTTGLLVLKVPGHKYWSRRGAQGYAGAELQVYRIQEVKESDEFSTTVRAERLMEIPVARAHYPNIMHTLEQIKERS